MFAQGSGAFHNQQLDDMISVELEGRSKAPLNNVGLVVWQSAFVLADYLIAHPPFRTWREVNVIELGSGTGQGSFRTLPCTSCIHQFWLVASELVNPACKLLLGSESFPAEPLCSTRIHRVLKH